MSRSKIALLIIDAQVDFCYASGSLYVPGAERDVQILGDFIRRNKNEIDDISMTMDSHQVIDISHPGFWQNKDKNHPNPFTQITSAQVESGEWTPLYWPQEALKYLKDLEAQGEYPHYIWPEHCIIGTPGAAIVDEIMNPVREWCRLGNLFNVVAKGTHPLTEHFSAVKANIEIPGRPETHINLQLIQKLSTYNTVYLAGEAKSHCVANTLKDLIKFPDLAKRIVILEDCTSNVPGFEHMADNIYSESKSIGVRFENAASINL